MAHRRANDAAPVAPMTPSSESSRVGGTGSEGFSKDELAGMHDLRALMVQEQTRPLKEELQRLQTVNDRLKQDLQNLEKQLVEFRTMSQVLNDRLGSEKEQNHRLEQSNQKLRRMCGTLVDSYAKFEEEAEDPAEGDAMAEASGNALDDESPTSADSRNEFNAEEETLPPAVDTYAATGELHGSTYDADDTEPLSSAWTSSHATDELSVQAPKSSERGRGRPRTCETALPEDLPAGRTKKRKNFDQVAQSALKTPVMRKKPNHREQDHDTDSQEEYVDEAEPTRKSNRKSKPSSKIRR